MSEVSADVARYLEWLAAELRQWGALLLFVMLFLECIPLAGFAVPGLTVLVIAGFLAAGQSFVSAAGYFLASLAGVVAADNLAYLIGRAGYDRIGVLRRLMDRQAALREDIRGQKLPILLLYQFPPYSRMFAPLLMGALSFAWPRWLLVMSAGSVAFVSTFFLLGYAAGATGRAVFGAVSAASTVSALFVFGLLAWAVMLGIRMFRNHRKPQARPT
jgi:membrane protein DedA with SNARE-associated domain